MFQKTQIIGRLGKEPEMRFAPNGMAITSFTVAIDNFKREVGKQAVSWYKVTAFGKTAESCNAQLKKGNLVFVEGKLAVDPDTGNPRIWVGKDGVSHSSLEIIADTVRFLVTEKTVSDDDLPF